MKYRVEFNTPISLSVTVVADDEETAEDEAWDLAESYLNTVHGDNRGVIADATLDGVAATTVSPLGGDPDA